MKESDDITSNDKKRKRGENEDENKDASNKLKKKSIEFESDEEFEKYLINHFKKEKNDNIDEYVFSDIIKKFYNDIKKYKTIDDMANEIKNLAIESISKNLELICNNECTSSFFIEKYRVKYMNEQAELNIKSAQNNFKEFMILYNNDNFDNFSLEVNTNIEEKKGENDIKKNETQKEYIKDEEDKNEDGDNDTVKKENKTNEAMTKENVYQVNIWKEKIKCKIENVNENNNILIKIVNYLSSIALHVDHIPTRINKFDILKKLNELDYDPLNINIWDTYNSKEVRPFSLSTAPSFHRKANIYFKKSTKMNELLNHLREKAHSINIKGWNFNNVKRNNYHYLDFRLCPPICSHDERIKIDYKYAKNIVRKLDRSCHIDSLFIQSMEEENDFEDKRKKRKTGNEAQEKDAAKEETAPKGKGAGKRGGRKKKDNNDESNNANDLDNIDKLDGEESYIIEIIEENTDLDTRKKLDILILYLRLVHNFCYYSARKFNTYDEMVRECGYFYLRVNLDNAFYTNLIPIFYENYNVKRLGYYMNDKSSTIHLSGNNNGDLINEVTQSDNFNKGNDEINANKELQLIKDKFFKNEEISYCQLKWVANFDQEINAAIKENYNEIIDIEQTNEFKEILNKGYILKKECNTDSGTNKTEIRCAKCMKLFNNITDVPNHIFIKHNQIKMKLITETEAQIMQRYFYKSPHSFNFFFMMEKKHNSNTSKNYLNNKSTYFKKNNYKNQNFHLLTNNSRDQYKDFDDPNANFLDNVKQSSKKNSDFYDDT
ncbi:conserved Plasmodium protein, unknown function [Plasmodium vinckei brucechwatti]|uniref:C2H2-type domain-containing protein n=1 Tax=Plasmodium vinckei brucechwatti TaxID=119398 RepID=A0A6V7SP07_PLAVN|nr:conserved Plasmodium protein, unknown function [Plasmodium vinckei brucechwatti]